MDAGYSWDTHLVPLNVRPCVWIFLALCNECLGCKDRTLLHILGLQLSNKLESRYLGQNTTMNTYFATILEQLTIPLRFFFFLNKIFYSLGASEITC